MRWDRLAEDADVAGGVGGLFVPMTAGAALLIGDIVYLSAASTVNKTLVAATNLAMVGIVVGGDTTYSRVVQEDAAIGTAAAASGAQVLVAVAGVAKILSDAAITLGNKVTAATATTAGRGKTGTVTTDLVAGDGGRIIGVALNTVAGAGLVVKVLIQP